MRKTTLLAATAAALIAAGGAYGYVHHSQLYPSTDDAYLDAHVVHVAAEVSGPVIGVHIANQRQVRQGDALFEIDATPYELALAQTEAHLQGERQSVAQDEAAVASAQAEVHNREVLLANAERRMHRAHELIAQHYIAQQANDDADANYRSAQAALDVARAELHVAQQRLGTPGDDNQRIREAQAAVGQAHWNLDHTHVTAACDGRISELSLRPGDSIRTGTPVFVLVCDGSFSVYANFKETELGRIRTGQAVEIHLDMYPDQVFRGEVESINAASGAAFSLLPPENATGNWVKVTQRVPVRIRLPEQNGQFPLRVGTSATVTIDTDRPVAATADRG